MTNTLKQLLETVLQFRDERDWKQFHNPKDMALSLALEASEVLELFQWKNETEIDSDVRGSKELGEELSDVLTWILLLAHDLNIDLEDAFQKKFEKNAVKYPVDKARGKKVKYDKLS